MDWSDVIRRFKDLRSLIDTKPVFRWGVVTNADPLLVQLDGDDRPLAGSPAATVRGMPAGERVLCVVQNRRATIIGSSKGGRILALGGYDETSEPSFVLERRFNELERYVKLYASANGSRPEAGLQVGVPNGSGGQTNQATFYLDGDGSARITTHAGSPTANASRPIPFAIAVGSVSASDVVAAGATTVTVSFPSNRFTTTPVVLAVPTGGQNIRDVNTTVVSRTSTQAVIRKGSVSQVTRNFGFFWVAIQMTPTSMD